VESVFDDLTSPLPDLLASCSRKSAVWLLLSALILTAPRTVADVFDHMLAPILVMHANPNFRANVDMRLHALRWAIDT